MDLPLFGLILPDLHGILSLKSQIKKARGFLKICRPGSKCGRGSETGCGDLEK